MFLIPTYRLVFYLPVGPLYVNQSVPKMEDVEKEMSIEFSGWVSKGGSWKPTECQARVKVSRKVFTCNWCDFEFIPVPFKSSFIKPYSAWG